MVKIGGEVLSLIPGASICRVKVVAYDPVEDEYLVEHPEGFLPTDDDKVRFNLASDYSENIVYGKEHELKPLV